MNLVSKWDPRSRDQTGSCDWLLRWKGNSIYYSRDGMYECKRKKVKYYTYTRLIPVWVSFSICMVFQWIVYKKMGVYSENNWYGYGWVSSLNCSRSLSDLLKSGPIRNSLNSGRRSFPFGRGKFIWNIQDFSNFISKESLNWWYFSGILVNILVNSEIFEVLSTIKWGVPSR